MPAPTEAENIEARLGAIAAELAGTQWGPDFSDQGRSVSLLAYRQSLLAEQKQLHERLLVLQGPFTIVDVGRG